MKNIEEMTELEKVINGLDPRINEIAASARKILEKNRDKKDKNKGMSEEFLKEHFSMLMITLEFGLSADDVRQILLTKYPTNSPKRELLIKYINSNDLKERMLYPGGYDGFIEDYNNGIYGGIIE